MAAKKKSHKQSLTEAIQIAQTAIELLHEKLLNSNKPVADADSAEEAEEQFGGKEIKQLTDLAKLLMDYDTHLNKKRAAQEDAVKQLSDEELVKLAGQLTKGKRK